MHVPELDNLLWIASDAGQLLLLAILIARRLYRTFPIFSAFILWELVSDLLLFLTISTGDGYLAQHYVQIYCSFSILTYLLELCVLLEIAANVLHPAKRVLTRGFLYSLLGSMLAISIASFLIAAWVNPTPFTNLRIFLVMNTTAAILCLITFLLIAGFSQVLGVTWRNQVLQLATGLAFYSVAESLVELIQSQLHAGPSYASQYRLWGRFEVIGYLLTLAFWCYAFVKKEAPRKEFSPQMTKILVSLSGSAKRQRAVLARSRDD